MIGQKLLVVEPLRVNEKTRPDSSATGRTFIAVDTVGAGEGEVVLIVQGSSARFTPQTKPLPVDCAIIGIVDTVHLGAVGDLRLQAGSGEGGRRMSDAANQVSPNQAGRSAQIVVGGLMMGLAFFGAIAAYCVNGQPRQGMANGNGLIANIAVGFFVFAMVIGLVVSRMAVANSVRRITAENPENRPEIWEPSTCRNISCRRLRWKRRGFSIGSLTWLTLSGSIPRLSSPCFR